MVSATDARKRALETEEAAKAKKAAKKAEHDELMEKLDVEIARDCSSMTIGKVTYLLDKLGALMVEEQVAETEELEKFNMPSLLCCLLSHLPTSKHVQLLQLTEDKEFNFDATKTPSVLSKIESTILKACQKHRLASRCRSDYDPDKDARKKPAGGGRC